MEPKPTRVIAIRVPEAIAVEIERQAEKKHTNVNKLLNLDLARIYFVGDGVRKSLGSERKTIQTDDDQPVGEALA